MYLRSEEMDRPATSRRTMRTRQAPHHMARGATSALLKDQCER
jgi:hypothetical protein